MKKLILATLAAGLLFGASCTKQGPVGPQGPTGNANVIGSNSVTVTAWEKAGNTYSATFAYPDITPAIASYGLVEVYKYYASDGSWTNLPDIYNGVSTVFNFSPGYYTIYVENIDGTTTAFPGTATFRVVVIPSSVRQANPNTNWKDYNQAMAALNAAKAQAAAASL